MELVMVSVRVIGVLFMVFVGEGFGRVLNSDGSLAYPRTTCRVATPCDPGGQCCLKYFHGTCYYGDAKMPDTCIEDISGRCATSVDCDIGDICEGAWSNKWGSCGPHPCSDGQDRCHSGRGQGECVVTGDTYRCNCTDGWAGGDCSLSHPCVSEPCGDFGDCIADGDSYTCTCTSPDWSGPWCSIEGPCVTNPCLNSGTCTPGDGGGFTCACTDAWIGATCATPHPCDTSPTPCQEAGACFKEGPDYRCLCGEGLWGQNCTSSCNIDIGRDESDFPGTIQFPPEGTKLMPPNVFCRFRARTRNNARAKVKLVFERFDLEDHPTCAYDRLIVRDGATEIAASPFCGSELPPDVTTSGGVLIMRLRTDRAGRSTGFKAKVFYVN